MIFHRITVDNMFSYKGQQTYEFAPASEGSVALVIGRNGFGKTSLLNAIKLLFLGTEDKTLRRVGFPPRTLTRSDFVLGMPRGWAGIRNRHAEGSSCSVRAELGGQDGATITIERSWDFSERPFGETLTFRESGRPEVKDAAAEERLSELLPRELIPFFFFDGEEVQFLAETTDTGRAEAMERLLSLSYITGVEAQLREIVKTWSREALPQDVQVEIKEHEGRLGTVQAEIVALRHKAEDKRRTISEERDREEHLSRRMADMRAGGSVADSRRLEADIKDLEGELESELSVLATDLATDAPLLANPGLVKAAIQPLTEVIEHKSKAANSVAETLNRVLPERLFAEPPQPKQPLSPEQRKFFEDKLRAILGSYAVTDASPPPFLDSLDLARARDLLHRFNRWGGAMSALRQDRAKRLREVSAKRAQLERMKAEHREMQVGGGERAKEYQQLEEDFKNIGRTIGKLEIELEQLEAKIAEKIKQEGDVQSALNALERRHHQAAMTGERLGIAVALRETFYEYRQRNRAARRAQIEEAVNRHFRSLMTGHRMIDRISIDEDFVMRFLDADGAEFGQLTVSHGMRQLAVTALLWALKEVSGRELPIIVDTPLARIDRANQHNLLRSYYPHAAEQVIILATDSEIDPEKFELLQPHVGVQFRLENSDGQSTQVIRTGTDRLATEQVDG